MKFNYADLDTCHTASGLVIVIDVLRAFSSAAYAFSRGAKDIRLVGTVDEALVLKSRIPNAKTMGEVGGLPPEGFNFGNSPSQIVKEDLRGVSLIQRTGAGTQGVVRCVQAQAMMAASYVVATATVRYASQSDPHEEVTFVITGGYNNDEDLSCAEYLQSLFQGKSPPTEPFIKRVYASKDAEAHLDPNRPEFPLSDLDLCTRIDTFNFAMPIQKEQESLIMRAIK